MLPLDHFESADAAADVHADVLGDIRRDLEAGAFHRELGRGDGELDKARHLLDLFFLDPARRVEVLHFAGDPAIETGSVELRNRADAAVAFLHRAPCLFGAGPDRR